MASTPVHRKGPKMVPPPASARGRAANIDIEIEDSAQVERGFFPTLKPNAKFLLAYHPGRWGVVAGRVLPIFARVPLMPGIGGVDLIQTAAGEKLAYTEAIRSWEDRGWTVIRHAHAPNGKCYITGTQLPDGVHHHTVWESTHISSSRISCDYAGYAAWINGLLASGVLPPPHIQGLLRLRDRHSSRQMAYAELGATSPTHKALADRFAKDLIAIDASLAEFEVEVGGVTSVDVDVEESAKT